MEGLSFHVHCTALGIYAPRRPGQQIPGAKARQATRHQTLISQDSGFLSETTCYFFLRVLRAASCIPSWVVSCIRGRTDYTPYSVLELEPLRNVFLTIKKPIGGKRKINTVHLQYGSSSQHFGIVVHFLLYNFVHR